MAEKKPTKAKRVVKNPETFRERAVKAAEVSDKPKRAARLKGAGSKAAQPVFKPVGKASSKVFGAKAFKPVRKVGRVIGKVLLPSYIRQSWKELRLVTWPTWQESRRLTFAVLIFAIVFGVTVAIVDFGLDKLFRDILLK